MSIFENTIKIKKVFIVILVLMILFVIGGGVLGYFYYKKHQAYKSLLAEKNEIQTNLDNVRKDLDKANNELETTSVDLRKDLKDCESDKSALEEDLKDLNAASASYEDKNKVVKAYAEFLKYLSQIINAHNGLDGISEAEFQQGYSLAQATGNSDFAATVNWAWHTESVSQAKRLARVMLETAQGILDNT